jgi:SOS-response transcriptional repressor LexA
MQSITKLTERQHEVLVHFTDTVRKTGAPPTIRAIKTHFGFSTPRGAEVHLKALAAKGYASYWAWLTICRLTPGSVEVVTCVESS